MTRFLQLHPAKAVGTLLVIAMLGGCGGEPTGEPIRFAVEPGSGLSAVADTLGARDVVNWSTGFKLYGRLTGGARSIKAGVYEVRRGTAWGEIMDKLISGDVVEYTMTVPEGWTLEEIGQRLSAVTDTPHDSVRAFLTRDSAAAAYGVPGPTLEGYLYPATYRFPLGTPFERVVETMAKRYKRVWTAELRARADSLGLSEREVVTLASIIEKEAKRWGERDTISAVYNNRLRIGMPLQADPTVQYALGEHQGRLLYAHIDQVADHPYNTYTQRGLPPGPIASPSEGSIRAALYPADVNHLYFVAAPDGSHIFTGSLEEHNAAKRRVQSQ